MSKGKIFRNLTEAEKEEFIKKVLQYPDEDIEPLILEYCMRLPNASRKELIITAWKVKEGNITLGQSNEQTH